MPNLPTDWRAARDRENKTVAEGRMSKSSAEMRQKTISVILFLLHTVSNEASLNKIKSEHGETAERNGWRQTALQRELGRRNVLDEHEHETETRK